MGDLKTAPSALAVPSHTPGPWWWEGEPGGSNLRFKEGEEYDSCVLRYDSYEGIWFSGNNEAANARLIAAAPVLYNALRALVEHILDYERVNKLSPNPGREYCWDVTARAVAALSQANEVRGNQGDQNG